jgi:hypothetical protein
LFSRQEPWWFRPRRTSQPRAPKGGHSPRRRSNIN